MLQGAISFGSAFEGWIAREEKEVVHHVLVPLTPPRGHTFHPEDDADGGRPSRNFVSVWSWVQLPKEEAGCESDVPPVPLSCG